MTGVNGTEVAERPDVEAEDEPPAGPSILDDVRAAHRRNLDREEYLELTIPLQNDLLAVRYKRASWSTIAAFAALADDRSAADGQMDSIIDALVDSCMMILYQDEDGVYKPLHEVAPDLGPLPVRFDGRLAEVLGEDAPERAREVVRLTFGRDRELDIIDHGSQLVGFSYGGAKRVNEVVLGESLGDRT